MYETIGRVVTVLGIAYLVLWIVPYLVNILIKLATVPSISASKYITKSHSVLITGGGGEVGACLTIRFAQQSFKHIILWDLDYKSMLSISKSISVEYGYVPILVTTKELFADITQDAHWSSVFFSDCDEFDAKIIQSSSDLKYCVCVLQDLTCSSTIESTFSRVCEILNIPSPTILINNAGIVKPFCSATSDLSIFDQTMLVNTRAPFQLARVFLNRITLSTRERLESLQPETRLQKKYTKDIFPQYQLVTISSAAGYSYAVGLGPYCASKAAISSLHKSLRLELARIATEEDPSIAQDRVSLNLSSAKDDSRKLSQRSSQASWLSLEWFSPLLWLFQSMAQKIFLYNTFSKILSHSCDSNTDITSNRLAANSVKTLLVTPWRIKTKMFQGVRNHPLVSYFFPALETDLQVCKEISNLMTTHGYLLTLYLIFFSLSRSPNRSLTIS